MKRTTQSRLPRWSTAWSVAAFLPLAGCDPMLEIDGAFFPAWLVCLLLAFIPTLAARELLRRTGLETHCRPLSLTYLGQYVSFVLLLWLIFFRD